MAFPMAGGCPLTARSHWSLLSSFRNLSLTPKRAISTTRKASTHPRIPPYPYGARQWFKQADNGLYGGSTIQFGNKISKGRNKGKTRRVWKPNIRIEKLYSEALGKDLEVKVQHRVLRTIRKVGGLDEYLLGDKPARIKELGLFGWDLRWRVMMSGAMKRRFEKQRRELGLAQPERFKDFLARYSHEEQVQAAMDDQAAGVMEKTQADQAESPLTEETTSEIESETKSETESAAPAPEETSTRTAARIRSWLPKALRRS
jgi:large subunit ribosomal protein L28